MRRLLLIGLLVAASASLWAQEALVGIYANPHARPQPKSQISRMAATPLELPVVDDFADGNAFPNTAIWESAGVFVNTTYPINPPSIGVATFDGQDENGKIYPYLGSIPEKADELTSTTINLSGKTGVVLSFFYQPGGLGDMPEPTDIFKLEFYAPSAGSWIPVWTASANERDTTLTEVFLPSLTPRILTDSIGTKFHYVAIAIEEALFLQSGFRFRFSNMASMGASPVPGKRSNCDHWHLDYVYLNSNRTVNDTLLPDVAICEPQQSLALAYSSVPAAHLNTADAQRNLFGNPMQFSLTYQNLGWGPRNITRRFSITPGKGAEGFPQNYTGGSENILNGQKFVRDYSFEPYQFNTVAGADSAEFEVRSYIITDVDPSPLRVALRHNDTTRYLQRFYDYYSYDDGSAENGYGLYGTGTSNGQVAIRYTSYAADSLRGISMYFNLALDSANAKAFKIAVWADENGLPGKLLYSEKVNSPAFSDGLNKFTTFRLPKALAVQKGQTFYIGWIQTSEVFLNIGYDVNSQYINTNYCSIGNLWVPSEFRGSLMIRPVFGKATPGSGSQNEQTSVKAADNWVVYPNPARERVTVANQTTVENAGEVTYRIELYDVNGTMVQNISTGNGNFPVAALPNGLYVLRIYENGEYKASRKLVISK